MALPNSEKITSQLATLPDQALKQMAMMHKADPYILPLIISEDGRRKQMRQAAQAQMGQMAQPKVIDAAVDQMGMLPEDQGIARLPTPNIQGMADGGIAGYDDGGMALAQRSEPVLRMADGGMAGYMPGFNKTGAVNAAFEEAFQKTLGYEGGYVEDDAGKGPSKFGINKAANPDIDIKKLTKDQAREIYKKRYWDAIGGDSLVAKDPALAKVAFDTAVNMGPAKAKQLVERSKGDPAAMLQMRQQHYDDLVKKDPEKFAPYEKGWRARVADLATSVIPSAQAAEPPKATPTDSASQIPGHRMPAPAATYDQTNSFFGRLADKMGIPLEAQRQIGTTLNAPTPLAPVVGAVKSGSGLAGLGERIGNKLGFLQGPAGRMSAEEIAALQKQSGGLKALEASQQVTKEAQAAGATLDEQEYLRKMIEANRAKEAADKYSKASQIAEASQAREAVDVANAQRLSKAGQQAQAAGRVDALADNALQGMSPAASATGYTPSKMEPVSPDEFGGIPEPVQEKAIEIGKAATPEKKGVGLSDDDYLSLGLRLMASKSRNLLAAVGESGIGALADKREREKAVTEKAYREAQTKYSTAYADAIERGAKEKNEQYQVEKLIQDAMSNWDKNNKMTALQDPTARTREEERIRQQIYANLGLKPIMGAQTASSAANPDPLGILSKKG
jgi:lysozyme family protein